MGFERMRADFRLAVLTLVGVAAAIVGVIVYAWYRAKAEGRNRVVLAPPGRPARPAAPAMR